MFCFRLLTTWGSLANTFVLNKLSNKTKLEELDRRWCHLAENISPSKKGAKFKFPSTHWTRIFIWERNLNITTGSFVSTLYNHGERESETAVHRRAFHHIHLFATDSYDPLTECRVKIESSQLPNMVATQQLIRLWKKILAENYLCN